MGHSRAGRRATKLGRQFGQRLSENEAKQVLRLHHDGLSIESNVAGDQGLAVRSDDGARLTVGSPSHGRSTHGS